MHVIKKWKRLADAESNCESPDKIQNNFGHFINFFRRRLSKCKLETVHVSCVCPCWEYKLKLLPKKPVIKYSLMETLLLREKNDQFPVSNYYLTGKYKFVKICCRRRNCFPSKIYGKRETILNELYISVFYLFILRHSMTILHLTRRNTS